VNAGYARRVAAECDDLLGQLTTQEEASPALRLRAVEALARAAAVLHMVTAGPESSQERMNGSGSVQDTREAPEGQQGTSEPVSREVAYQIEELRERLKKAEIVRDVVERSAVRYRKRWHQAADQRDALVRAIRRLWAGRTDSREAKAALDDLLEVVERVENEDPSVSAKSATLRRELWAVLDRMPASDDDLIASIRKLKEGQ
jgi:hypothetical protein